MNNEAPLSSYHQQTLALAGVVQSAALVDKLARTGYDNNDVLRTQIYALLQTAPESTEAVFKGRQNLRSGIQTLRQLLNQDRSASAEILRYSLGMLHLQRRLNRRKDMLAAIGSRLQQAKTQTEHFSLDHENVIANLASIYGDTISTFRFRIQVNGNPLYLRQEDNVNKIRCLLLSGIRCATLWQQCGGSRFSLLFHRQRFLSCCDDLLRLSS